MASLLETFFIQFTSNADQVKRGNDDARRSTNDLEASLNAADGAGVALGESLMATFASIGAGLLAGLGIDALKDRITETADLDAKLGLLSKRLGIGVSDLDAWGRAALLAGGDVGGLTQTLDFLNRGMADIATKGTSRLKPFFDELKIQTTDGHRRVRPLLDILGDLSDRLSKMSAQQAAGIAEKLGIDQGTLLLLMQGRIAVDDRIKRQKEMGVATEESAARALEYRTQTLELDDALESLYRNMGASLIPAMTDFLKWVQRIVEYLERHKNLVIGFFIGVGAAIGTYYLPAIVEAAVATIAAVGPYLLLAAAVLAVGAAFALAYDDVQAFLAGNKSVLGELIAKYPETFEVIKTILRDVGAVVMWLGDVIGAVFGLAVAVVSREVGVINSMLKVLGVVFNGVTYFITEFGKNFGTAFPMYAKIFGVFADFVTGQIHGIGKALEWLFGLFTHLGDLIRGVTGFVNDPAGTLYRGLITGLNAFDAATLPAGRAVLAGVNTSPYNAAPSTVNGGARTVHIENLNVAAPQGTDPASWSDAISRGLQTQLRDAANHFDDGVSR